MKLLPISSSNLKEVGYDENKQKLSIRFHRSDSTYIYSGVPRRVYSSLLKAVSKGQYFTTRIKGRYAYIIK